MKFSKEESAYISKHINDFLDFESSNIEEKYKVAFLFFHSMLGKEEIFSKIKNGKITSYLLNKSSLSKIPENDLDIYSLLYDFLKISKNNKEKTNSIFSLIDFIFLEDFIGLNGVSFCEHLNLSKENIEKQSELLYQELINPDGIIRNNVLLVAVRNPDLKYILQNKSFFSISYNSPLVNNKKKNKLKV